MIIDECLNFVALETLGSAIELLNYKTEDIDTIFIDIPHAKCFDQIKNHRSERRKNKQYTNMPQVSKHSYF